MADRRIATIDITKLSTIITIIVGLGTIGVGAFYTLDYFYVSRVELTAFVLQNQQNNQETMNKLSELENGVITLTRIYLKGELSSLNRSIDSLEAIETRTNIEEEYLFSLREDRDDFEDQLDNL